MKIRLMLHSSLYSIGLHNYCRCCQLENMLLSKCEDESDNLNSEVDVEVS
jgi:hypothetical protein